MSKKHHKHNDDDDDVLEVDHGLLEFDPTVLGSKHVHTPHRPNRDKTHTALLTVKSPNGTILWEIFPRESDGELDRIIMSDGGIIKRAEGREIYILALPEDDDTLNARNLRFFIIDTMVLDPLTGNFYIEANGGTYGGAFLNNGWQAHQYRLEDGTIKNFVTEPKRTEKRSRNSFEVADLEIDTENAEVRYRYRSGSVVITLRCRKIGEDP